MLHNRCGFGWTGSADVHGILRAEVRCVIAYAEANAEVEGRAGEVTVVCLGHRHGQREKHLEAITAQRPPRQMVIVHVMEPTDLYRRLLHEEGEENTLECLRRAGPPC